MARPKRRRTKPPEPAPTVVRDRAEVVTVEEILKMTGIGRATFYRWIEQGLLPAALGVLQRKGRKGNPPAVWDLAVVDRIVALRHEKIRLPE